MVKNGNMILPDYTIKVSPRARNVWIRISADKGLEVVIPRWFSRKNVPELLLKEKDWIKRATNRLMAQEKSMIRENPIQLPTQVHLKALVETWNVKYQKTPSPTIRITHNNNSTLILSGDIDDKEKCREELRKWLKQKSNGPGDTLAQTVKLYNAVAVQKGDSQRAEYNLGEFFP